MADVQPHFVRKADPHSQLSCRVSGQAKSGLLVAHDDAESSSTMQRNDQHVSGGTQGMASELMQRDAAGRSTKWHAGSGGKLFDKELDNHHEEKLLLAQVTTGLIYALLHQSPSQVTLASSCEEIICKPSQGKLLR